MCKDCILNIVAFLQAIRSPPANGSVVSYIVILLCSSNEE